MTTPSTQNTDYHVLSDSDQGDAFERDSLSSHETRSNEGDDYEAYDTESDDVEHEPHVAKTNPYVNHAAKVNSSENNLSEYSSLNDDDLSSLGSDYSGISGDDNIMKDCGFKSSEISPFLTFSNFRPISVESTARKVLFHPRVLNSIPDCFLGGTFLQLGPNANMEFDRTQKEKENWRWIDGDGMLYSMQFLNVGSDPQIVFRNRYIRTAWHEVEHNEQKQCTEGPVGYISSLIKWQVKSFFVDTTVDAKDLNMRKDVSNICVVWHYNRLLTVGNAGIPHEIALPDLGTVSTIPLNNTWKSLYFIPHVHVDPRTDELLFFAFSLSAPFLRLGCMAKDGKMRYDTPIPNISKPTLFHDFALTDNYIIFFLCPVQFQVSMSHKLFGGVPPTTYDCTENTLLGIMRRYPPGVKKVNSPSEGENSEDDSLSTAESFKWISLKSCYVTHIANAYEQDAETLVIYATKTPQYLDTTYSGSHSNESALSEHKASLCRFVVDLEFSEIREHTLLNHAEHPVCRREFYGSKNQFIYCLEYKESSARIEDPDVPLYKSVVKIDLNNQNKTHYFFGSNRYGGEVTFVPSNKLNANDFQRDPNVLKKTQEDDGYLLCFVYDEISESTDLVVLDAKTMNESFTVSLPLRVPFGTHTEWVSKEEYSRAIPKPWK